MEHEEPLQPGALVGQLADAVQHDVYDLLADGVVAPGVVVGRVLLAGDELLGVEQLPVRTGPHLICNATKTPDIGKSDCKLGPFYVSLTYYLRVNLS